MRGKFRVIKLIINRRLFSTLKKGPDFKKHTLISNTKYTLNYIQDNLRQKKNSKL